MSHMVTRKGPVGDDKEKRQADSPVKEMKKKIAANAEKEKQAAEKGAEKTEKAAEKSADKKDKAADKHTDKSEKKDKVEKQGEKPAEKKDKGEKHGEKSAEKKEKNVEKNVEKVAEKKDKREKSVEKLAEKKDKIAEKAAEKKEKTDKKDVPEKAKDEASSSAEKSGKVEKAEGGGGRKEAEAVKLNGAQNGSANGGGSSSEDDELMIVEQPDDNDEMFPELAYDDNSDADGFEPDAARSLTRRSQVKATRTPETPRPASAAQQPRDADHSKEPKVLRLKEDAAMTDRRLRSANSPKPGGKHSPRKTDSPSKADVAPRAEATDEAAVIINVEEPKEPEGNSEKSERPEMEVVIEVENSEDGDATRRDTRYSRSRVKVSPYRRSARLADATHTSFLSVASHTSLMANYTGNNTTMETDMAESSLATDAESPPPSPRAPPAPPADDSYLAGLRAIRGRRSYKAHAHAARPAPPAPPTPGLATGLAGRDSRPTGTVVGRKRRPDAALDGEEREENQGEAPKRARLLERLARPFRTAHSTPLPARRAAEIVGINTDLPLTAPVAAEEAFDPESIKPPPPAPALAPLPLPTPTPPRASADSKRCVLM